LLPSQKLQTLVGELLGEGTRLSFGEEELEKLPGGIVTELDASMSEVNIAYEHVMSMLRKQLVEVENESTNFQ
jgi:hypothetical protein